MPIDKITEKMIEDAYQNCRKYYDPELSQTGNADQFYQIKVAY